MSQHTPNYFHFSPPPPRHLAIARRAGALMIALGIVVLLSGGCVLLASAMPLSQLPADTQEKIQQLETQSHVTLHAMFMIMGGLLMAIALYQIVMGLLVRRGGKASIITAIVVTALLATVWALQLFAALASGSAPNVAAGAGILLISVCLMAWQLAWLIQALHAARGAAFDAPTFADPQQPIGQPPIGPLAAEHSNPFIYPPPPPDAGPIGWPYPPPPPSSLPAQSEPRPV